MKKLTIILLIMLLVLTQIYAQSKSETKKKNETRTERRSYTDTITKTYILKYVSPSVVSEVLRPYILQKSYSNSTMMFTVVLPKKNQKIFEEILKKMDVKKKDIKLKIYTVIGKSDSSKTEPIKNKNLVSVLKKLNNLMNFKGFTLDGVSFISLKDGQKKSKLKLSSNSNKLDLIIANVRIIGNKKDGREVKFHLNFWEHSLGELIKTETSVKENGYLIAGVSKIGEKGNSIILVISAEIEK